MMSETFWHKYAKTSFLFYDRKIFVRACINFYELYNDNSEEMCVYDNYESSYVNICLRLVHLGSSLMKVKRSFCVTGEIWIYGICLGAW